MSLLANKNIHPLSLPELACEQHFASTFAMQIFKFQRPGSKLSFLFPPRRQSAPESLLADYIWATGAATENIHTKPRTTSLL